MRETRKVDPILILLAVVLSLTLIGCGRISQQADQTTDINMTLTVHPNPPGVGPAQLIVSVTGADGSPIDGAQLQIKGDMTHAGMEPVLAQAEGGVNGKYEIPFEWTMGGDWIVSVTAILPDGRTTIRQFTYTVQGDMSGMNQKPPETAETQ